MTSITGWSSITVYTPPARPDKRDKPDVSMLDQDAGGGLNGAEPDAGMKPAERMSERTAEDSGWAGMRMDTQSFATMTMQGPPPPPPPSLSELDSDDDGTITTEEFGVSSTDGSDEDDDLFNAIDTDDSGDLSADEVSAFEDKMKTLFSRVQQMSHAEYQSVAEATYQTNDANLNLSA